jgi:hypothetical protein
MNITELVASIDEEIARLQQVRAVLGGDTRRPAARKWHRKKRVLSTEARERIAAAQRKRWAAQKKPAKK